MTDFDPDWAVHPGLLLGETLADHKLSQAWLARATGLTPKHVNRVVNGRDALTPYVAVAVARALGKPRGYARTLARMQADHDVWRAWRETS